ncbi:nucleolin-like isoform 2-T2 [Acanthopagrus schlegelii]
MAKTEETKQRKRQSKVVNKEAVAGEDNSKPDAQTVSSSEQIVSKEESTDMKQVEQDPQMDAVIEVKGSASHVNVSWDEKNGEGVVDDSEKTTDASGQMMDSGEHSQMTSSADAAGTTEAAPSEATETNVKQETQESGDCQVDITVGERGSTIAVTWEEKKNKEGERDKQMNGKEKKVKGKRKVDSTADTSPSKKTKLINDGFCLFVGNLNTSKKFEEVRDSLANFFMTQSLLVQDIRLDRSRKHAHVDLASEMDLTKALTLNGAMVLDKPMKIDKAKIKDAEKVKVKISPADKKASSDAKCLFLKNLPYTATKEDIMKIFRKAVSVRFPDDAEGPSKGIAFVELKNKIIAKKLLQKRRVFKIQDRVLIVDSVGEGRKPQAATATDNKKTRAAAPPNNTLFVSNLSYDVNEKKLRSIFQKAVEITVPKSKGKARGFAFVEFRTVADAEEALQSTQNMKLLEREVKAQFYDTQEKAEKAEKVEKAEKAEKAEKVKVKAEEVKVLTTTLIVMGLAQKTTAETLKSAFEGASSARVILDKETGASKKYGFVDFENEESCKAAKEAMEDCEIDGSKVTVTYANPKGVKVAKGLARRPAGQKGAARGGRKDQGGKGSRGGKGHGAGKRKAVKKGGNKG